MLSSGVTPGNMMTLGADYAGLAGLMDSLAVPGPALLAVRTPAGTVT